MVGKRYQAQDVSSVAPLGEPLRFEFSGKTAFNRFLKAAMTERLSSWNPDDSKPDVRGIPSPQLINVYKRWGEGGFGFILTGNTMIKYNELEAKGNPIIPTDAPFSGPRFQAFADQASAAKKHGSLIICQVSHPGRQVVSAINKNPISASDVQLVTDGMTKAGMTFSKPRAATEEDIASVKEGFAHAAEYLYKAGYDGIQLHGAHGYLLAQFLSPTTNKRTDKYGGSLENRSRLIIEIADEIRKRVPKEFSVGIKLNSVEFQEGGFDSSDLAQLCESLEAHEFDYVELSGGTYEEFGFEHKKESTKKREAFFIEFAEQIVPHLKKTKVYVTGGFKTAAAMVEALKTVDGVGLGRPAATDPRLPHDILKNGVTAATEPLLGPDFMLTNVAAGTQIRQLGQDVEPLDLSSKEHLDAFTSSMGNWREKMSNDAGGYFYGYVDIDGVKTNPYGKPY